MLRRLVHSFLGIAALLFVAAQSSPDDARSEAALLPAHGIWEIAWDDVVDHRLNRRPKIARVKLAVAKGRIAGAFDGEVLGRSREAVFSGEVVSLGRTPLVLLQQRESGYVCVYQFQKLPSGQFRGVWYDTQARSGDVILRRADRREL